MQTTQAPAILKWQHFPPQQEECYQAIHDKNTMHGKCSVAIPFAKGCSGATAPLECMPPPACPLEERVKSILVQKLLQAVL